MRGEGGLYTKHTLGSEANFVALSPSTFMWVLEAELRSLNLHGKPFYRPSHLVSPDMINLNMSWPRTHFLSPKEYIYTTPLDTRDTGERDTKTVRGKR